MLRRLWRAWARSGIDATTRLRRQGGWRRTLAVVALALAPAVAAGGSARAQDSATTAFNIPAQPLSSAVTMFSRQSGISVIVSAQVVRGRRAPRVEGVMSPERALAALIAGTGLTITRGHGGVLVIDEVRPPAARRGRRGLAAAPAPRRQPSPPRPPPSPALATEIVVTGTRLASRGFLQPSPVTVIDNDIIARDARLSIGDTIRELPAVGRSASPNNSVGAGGIVAGNAGLDNVNLRQLGSLRTLLLFDGRRVIKSNINGQVDIGTLPSALIDRIEVVTGGASAAWGSDAVAGVVNLVLDKDFTGLSARVEIGDSLAGDHRTARASIAAGTQFARGRGHVIVTLDHAASPEVVFAGQREWNTYSALLENPDYTQGGTQPRYVRRDNIGLAQATTGGLIVGGPLGGTQFVGPQATPAAFDFGQVSGPVSAGGDAEQTTASLHNLTVAYRSTGLFAFASYDIGERLKVSAQVSHGRSRSHNSSVPVTRFGNLEIRRDNAFLPAATRQQMVELGLDTIMVGTTNLNNLPTGRQTLADLESLTVGVPTALTRRRVTSGVLALYGEIGAHWSWNAHYQRSQAHVRQDVLSNLIPANFNRAIDAVLAPPGNAAGIAPGTIVCRSTLTDPADGCVPLNIFGTGVASPGAIAYVKVRPGQNYQVQRLREDSVAALAQGVLPVGLPAGEVALALGLEHRRERSSVVTDPGAQARIYALGNFTPFSGSLEVMEGFVEAEVPLLLADRSSRSLNLNAAARLTDYSTSGRVATWKLGLTGQLTPDLRLRGTISRDIRAPLPDELFSRGTATSGSAIDPRTGANVPIFTFRAGNAQLRPEVARTLSAGLALVPRSLPGLALTLDYYNIAIRDAIATLTAPQILARCAAGDGRLCDQLVFGGPDGQLSQINLSPLNINIDEVEGLDYELNYNRPALGGVVLLRLIGNYVLRQSQRSFGTTIDYAGGIGLDNPVEGVPRARVNLSATYTGNRLSLTVQTRFVGAAQLVKGWDARDVDRNGVPAIAYVDLRAAYQFSEQVALYGALDNLFDQDPPILPATVDQGQNVYFFTATRGDLYDLVGPAWRAGVRARF